VHSVPREHADWSELTRSIHQNRASNALFYKPVCVIAAIDLANAGALVSDMLYAELIIRKFEQYVGIEFPSRASKGWWPLWFLANDGLWNFSKKGKALSKTGLAIRPTTKNKTLQRFDLQSIAPEYRSLWDSAAQRKVLRDHMLAIMNRYRESKVLVRALFDPSLVDMPDQWPTEAEVDAYLNDLSGQGDLFQDGETGADLKQPRSVAAVRKALNTFDIAALPPVSVIGPQLEVTGNAPIAINSVPLRDVTKAQVALYDELLQKCRQLENLASNSNRAAHLRPTLGKLVAALGGPAEQSNGYLIWSSGNTLRRLLIADLRARNAEDPDDPPLTERAGELLGDVVEQFNVYATTDHLVSLLDRARTGPATRSNLTGPLNAGSQLVEALREAAEIVTRETAKVVEVATENAQSAQGVAGFDADQAVVNAVEIQRNTAGGILRNALLEIKKLAGKAKGSAKLIGEGMAKQVGAETIKLLPIASFVNSAREAFTALWQGTASFNAVNHLIALIREFFTHFRG
jgi:hypothetical protein